MKQVRWLAAVALGVLAVWCALVAPPSAAQPPPPSATLAPTVQLSSSLGALGSRDPLVDPNPLFLFPDQTTISTLTMQWVNFLGPVELTATCCLNVTTRQPVPVSGVTVGVVPGQLTPPRGGTMQAKLVAFTANAPSVGSFIIRVTLRGQEGGLRTRGGIPIPPATVESTVDLLLHILPPIPGDVGVPPFCTSLLNSPGSTTFTNETPRPIEVLPLTSLTKSLFDQKAATPTKVRFFIGAKTATSRVKGNAWEIEIGPGTVTPALQANEVQVVLENKTDGNKEILTFNPATCTRMGQSLVLMKGETKELRISSASAPTLLLRREYCTGLWVLGGCWGFPHMENIAIFSPPPFWSLFGGRKVTISWFH